MMKKLSKQKLAKLLKEGLENYGVCVYPTIITNIAESMAIKYYKVEVKEEQEEDCQFFINVLNMERMANSKYVDVKRISKGTSHYTSVSKIIPSVNRFTELYAQGERDKGYGEYIKIGLKMMSNKYALTKFGYLDTKIFQLRDFQRQINTDPNRVATQKFQNYWDVCIMKEYGIVRQTPIQYNQYDQYVNFIWGRECADNAKADYKDWCMAQIEGFRFMGEPPFITSMHGDKALERYIQYKNHIKVKSKDKPIRTQEEDKKRSALLKAFKK